MQWVTENVKSGHGLKTVNTFPEEFVGYTQIVNMRGLYENLLVVSFLKELNLSKNEHNVYNAIIITYILSKSVH